MAFLLLQNTHRQWKSMGSKTLLDSTDFLCMDWDIFNCVFHSKAMTPLWEVVCCRLFTCFKRFSHGIFTLVCHSLGTCISVYSSSSMWYNNMNYQEVYYDREHIFLDPPTAEVLSFPLHTAADACSRVTLCSGKSSQLHLHNEHLGVGKRRWNVALLCGFNLTQIKIKKHLRCL